MTDPERNRQPGQQAAGRRWQPWWAGDRSRVRWTLWMSVIWTGLALLNLRGGDRITVINWGLLSTLGWLTGLTGLVLLQLRPDLATLRRRPNTLTATGCILAAAVTGVAGLAALEISVPDHPATGLIWFAAGLAATTGLGFVAYRSNNHAEAAGRFAATIPHRDARPPA